MMEETGLENSSQGWKKFLRKHMSMVAAFIAAVILVSVGAILVFLWFIGNAQSIGMVPETLGLWTMGYLITFILYAIFWELILIGIPVGLAAAAGWLWWRRLPGEEKKEYRFFRRSPRMRSGGGGGAASFLLFIAFCIKVSIDGNWNLAFAFWTLNYVVYSMLSILIWIVIIFGIPLAIVAVWWINREMKKP